MRGPGVLLFGTHHKGEIKMKKLFFIYLFLGGSIYGIQNALLPEEKIENVVFIQEAKINELKSEYALMGKKMNQEKIDLQVDEIISRKILFNEAIKHELHISDFVIQKRLVMNMEFVDPSLKNKDFDYILKKAHETNFVFSDNVIEKRLVQLMSEIFSTKIPIKVPSDERLENFARIELKMMPDIFYQLSHDFKDQSGNHQDFFLGKDLKLTEKEIVSYFGESFFVNLKAKKKVITSLHGSHLIKEFKIIKKKKVVTKFNKTTIQNIYFEYQKLKNYNAEMTRLRKDYKVEVIKEVSNV